MDKIFTLVARTRGGLLCSYVFEDTEDHEKWLNVEFPALEAKYGKLELTVGSLPGLKVGDTCRVIGEGADTFVIKGLIRYDDHRWGFILEGGDVEEVAKCY